MLRAGMVAPDETTFNYLKGRFRTEIRLVRDCRFGWLDFPDFHWGWLVAGLCAQKGTNGTRQNGCEILEDLHFANFLVLQKNGTGSGILEKPANRQGRKAGAFGPLLSAVFFELDCLIFSCAAASFTKQQRREV